MNLKEHVLEELVRGVDLLEMYGTRIVRLLLSCWLAGCDTEAADKVYEYYIFFRIQVVLQLLSA